MGLIHFENWDGVTAPNIPSGWNISADLVTATSGATPISSPNFLKLPAASSGTQTATWGTLDGNLGNVQIVGNVQFGTGGGVNNSSMAVFFRCNQSTCSYSTSSFYEFSVSGNNTDFEVNVYVSGSKT